MTAAPYFVHYPDIVSARSWFVIGLPFAALIVKIGSDPTVDPGTKVLVMIVVVCLFPVLMLVINFYVNKNGTTINPNGISVRNRPDLTLMHWFEIVDIRVVSESDVRMVSVIDLNGNEVLLRNLTSDRPWRTESTFDEQVRALQETFDLLCGRQRD